MSPSYLGLWTEPVKEQSVSSKLHPLHQVPSQLLIKEAGHLHSHKHSILPTDIRSSVLTTALEKCSYDRVHNAQSRKVVHVLTAPFPKLRSHSKLCLMKALWVLSSLLGTYLIEALGENVS